MGVVVSEQRAIRSPREGFRNEPRVDPAARKRRSEVVRGMWSGYDGGGRESVENG